jgi:hypothetical protein
MNKSEVYYAERKALENFDEWNDASGMFDTKCGYYPEIISVIEDAVHIGIQMALFGEVIKNKDGEIVREHSIREKK